MIKIESQALEINRPAELLYNFLSDFNNFEQLMPPQVSQWKSTSDSCSFNIQGMANISLKIDEKTPCETIRISATAATPVPLWMTWQFRQLEVATLTSLVLDADLNPMLAMMAKAPLGNFVNMLVSKLKELAEEGKLDG